MEYLLVTSSSGFTALARNCENCQQGYMTKGRMMDTLPQDRDGFRFRGGSIALDLAATLQARLTPSPRELLATPRDLDRWLVSAGLATSPPAAVLDADGQAGWQGSAAHLLASLARDAVHLFGGADAAQVRQCQAPACTLFFVDTSRSGDRRWCSMSACGNQAKVAEFRRRRSSSAPPRS